MIGFYMWKKRSHVIGGINHDLVDGRNIDFKSNIAHFGEMSTVLSPIIILPFSMNYFISYKYIKPLENQGVSACGLMFQGFI